jgi:hypothetical protein
MRRQHRKVWPSSNTLFPVNCPLLLMFTIVTLLTLLPTLSKKKVSFQVIRRRVIYKERLLDQIIRVFYFKENESFQKILLFIHYDIKA